MCGRFTLRTPSSTLASWFIGVNLPDIFPRYNIAPTQSVLALRTGHENLLEAVMLRWGLVPGWADDLKIGNKLINARSETAATKPAFRHAFKRQRCIILADGFYEWKATGQGKQPFLIQSTNSEFPLICFAGLWESWSPKKGRNQGEISQKQLELFADFNSVKRLANHDVVAIESCTILTTTANSQMACLHDRMPVILNKDSYRIWLDPEFDEYSRLSSILRPCPEDWLRMYPVSKLVNKPSVDDITCTEVVESPKDE